MPGLWADMSGAEQSPCEVYHRVEIPTIEPEVTRVSLHGGMCPCCARRFKAEAPAGLEPGSPFGPKRGDLELLLPAGFERNGQAMVTKDLNREVQERIALVFPHSPTRTGRDPRR